MTRGTWGNGAQPGERNRRCLRILGSAQVRALADPSSSPVTHPRGRRPRPPGRGLRRSRRRGDPGVGGAGPKDGGSRVHGGPVGRAFDRYSPYARLSGPGRGRSRWSRS